MIETIYRVTCDRCKERSQQNPMYTVGFFVKFINKLGWARINGEWHCPFCAKEVFAPKRKGRKDLVKRSGRLSKTAREALAQRMIDDEG